MSSDRNENWGECPMCGTPVLKDPDTGEAEACGNCAARASRWGLFSGASGILIGLVVLVIVLYLCFRILL